MSSGAQAGAVVSDDQVWAAMDDLRGFGSVLTEVIVGLVALRIRAPETFADLVSAPPSHMVSLLRHPRAPEFVDVFPDLDGRPVDEAHLPSVVHRVAGWPLPDPEDHAECGRLALRLIDHAAAARGRTGDHLTPACLVDLMVGLTEARAGERIHDPFSRAGELLVGAAVGLPTGAHARFSADTASHDSQRSTRAALLLAGVDVAIRTRPVLTGGEGESCDVVLLNPPFGMLLHDADDRDRRWRYGPPPRRNANFAWLQHALSLLADRGRAVVLMANNAGTSDNPSERAIRQAMLRAGVIDTVIALPDRLFPSTPIAPSLWLLRPPRPEPTPDVLLVDATSMGKVERGRRVLLSDEITGIRAACRTADRPPDPIAGFTALVPAVDLANSGAGLNPRAYIGSVVSRADVTGSAARLDNAISERVDLFFQLRARQETTDRYLSTLAEIRSALRQTPTLRTTLGAVGALKTGPGKLDDEPGGTSSVVVVPRGIRHNRIVHAGVTAAPGRAPAANYRLDEGDIVCVRVGQLGRQGVVGSDQAGWLLGPGCLRIRPSAEIDPRYLTYQLGTSAALDWLDRHATGSAIRGVSARVLGELPLAFPPLDEQQRIGALLGALDDEVETLENAAAQVVALRGAAATLLASELPELQDPG